MQYFDIHSHIHFDAYDEDRDEVLARMQEEGVGTITVGTDLASSKSAVELAQQHDNVYATIGVHPNDSVHTTFDGAAFAELAKSPRVVAVGECGLDYFRSNALDNDVKESQKAEFIKHIEFAKQFELPLMLHIRSLSGDDAYEDALEILESYPDVVGNVHFFAGSLNVAQRFWERGFTTSFTGVLTFTNDYDEVVKAAPIENILAETDAPFVAPIPYRGKRNEPTFVKHVVERIAEVRNEPLGDVQQALLENTKRVFRVSF